MALVGAGVVIIFFFKMFSSVNCDCSPTDFQKCSIELRSPIMQASSNHDEKALCEIYYKFDNCFENFLNGCRSNENQTKFLNLAEEMLGLVDTACVGRGYERGSGNSFRIEPLLIGLLILLGPLRLFQY